MNMGGVASKIKGGFGKPSSDPVGNGERRLPVNGADVRAGRQTLQQRRHVSEYAPHVPLEPHDEHAAVIEQQDARLIGREGQVQLHVVDRPGFVVGHAVE